MTKKHIEMVLSGGTDSASLNSSGWAFQIVEMAISLGWNKDKKNDWNVKEVLCSEVIQRIIRSMMKCL